MSARPTIRQLEYFIALEETLHFGRAAEACHVSQSGFSAGIKALEEAIGVRLFDRTRRSVVITPAGREVGVYARLVMRDLDALMELAGEQRAPLEGKLRLGVIPTIAPFLLPATMPALRSKYPAMRLFLVEKQTADLIDDLWSGRIDLALIALPFDTGRLESQVLFRDPLLLATARDGRFDSEDGVTLGSLPDESLLLLEDGHCLRDQAVDACTVRERSRLSAISGSSMLTVLEMVAGDLGVTLVPEMARGSSMLADSALVTHSLAGRFFRDIALVWRPGSAGSAAYRELGGTIRTIHDEQT